MDSLNELVSENEKFRIVYKPVAFLGPDSKTFSQSAYAANQAGKFKQVHSELIRLKRPYTKEDILAVLKKHGVKSNLDAQEASLEETILLSHQLKIKATPVFFIYNKTIIKLR